MKKFNLHLLFLSIILPSAAFSQGLVNNGAYLVLSSTSNVVVNGTAGNYLSQSGGNIANSAIGGKISVGGNWTNNAANTGFNNAGATVLLNSSSSQNISGTSATTFYNLSLTGAGSKIITNPSSNPFTITNDFLLSSSISYSNVSSILIGGDYNGTQFLSSAALPVTIGGSYINTAYGASVTGKYTYSGSTAASTFNIGALNYANLEINAVAAKTAIMNSNSLAPTTLTGLLTIGTNCTLNTNGNLTLKATSSTNANVGPLPATNSISGNVKVESFITGGTAANRSSRIMSPPINDAALSNKTYKQLQAYMVITGPGNTANGFDLGGYASPSATTINTYNEPVNLTQSQFIAVPTINESAIPGKGFFLFYRGNRNNYSTATSNTSNKVNPPYAIPESQLITYNGPLNMGDVTVPLSYTVNNETFDGYNLIGNPYACVVDVSAVTKFNVADLIIYIRPTGGYATYKAGVTTNAPLSSFQYLQPGQGIYVQANGSGAYVKFTESSKYTGSTAPGRFLNSPKSFLSDSRTHTNSLIGSEPTSTYKQLRMSLQDNVNTEEAVVVFNAGSSAAANAEDAGLFSGSSITLATLSSDNKDLVINFMPSLTEVSELKLKVKALASSSLKLNFTDLSAVEPFQMLLKDNYLNTLTDVRQNPVYDFNVDNTIAATSGAGRFSLLFTPTTTLPVNMATFTAKRNLKAIQLDWKISPAGKTNTFTVEKAGHDREFKAIGSVLCTTALAYSFTDNAPFTGSNYYRLKQTDGNGLITYTPLVSVDYRLNGMPVIAVYPNPTTDFIYVSIAEFKDKYMEIKISDISGHVISATAVNSNEKTLKIDVSKLPSGTYIINQIEAHNSVINSTKFVKK